MASGVQSLLDEGGVFMERQLIYLLAAADILLGFLILHRSSSRFGFDTYRSFLDREERMKKRMLRR
jgi:hypothetical protein